MRHKRHAFVAGCAREGEAVVHQAFAKPVAARGWFNEKQAKFGEIALVGRGAEDRADALLTAPGNESTFAVGVPFGDEIR